VRKTKLIPKRAFYHTACVKLLGPFIPLPFLEFDHGRSARALSLDHSEAILSVLKVYDEESLGRHDYWLLHTCEIAVKQLLLLEENLVGPTEDHLAKGCELLYRIGRYMPQANKILLDVSKHVHKCEGKVSDRVKRILQAGSARVRPTVIENASYLEIEGSEAGLIPAGRIAFHETMKKTER
jgi:hypothetical protein